MVVVDVAAGRPVHEQRCAPCNVQFACREHVLSEAQAELLAPGATPTPMHVPTRHVDGEGRHVDALALWRAAEAQRGARVLALSPLADVLPTYDALDRVALEEAPDGVAASIARVLCGIGAGRPPYVRECPGTARALRAEVSRWRRRDHLRARDWRQVDSLSAISARLGERCADMTCSADTCQNVVLRECEGRLRNTSAPAARDACAAWLRELPRPIRPLCDGVSGACIAPPAAFPRSVRWPADECIVDVAGGGRGRQGPRAAAESSARCLDPAALPRRVCAACVTT